MPIKKRAVDSLIGKMNPDSDGSAIGAVRMNPELSYSAIPLLLQKYINEDDEKTWTEITGRIDYIYQNMSHAMKALEKESGFIREITSRVDGRKKLLFKPNLVVPRCIDPLTHGPGNVATCTTWPFVAALMRWFHDKTNVSYHHMYLGEAASATSAMARAFTMLTGGKVVVTPQAVIEGKVGDFYGGWGFYFVRKYLSLKHLASHTDDPMRGYEESIKGVCLPPGRILDKLMVYDFNILGEDGSLGRDVSVAHGAIYPEITLHKGIVGGDPADPQDKNDWPGCVLINIPKLKVHSTEWITNAVKNLGIGLYPMEAREEDASGKLRWKYSIPNDPMPVGKYLLPHQPWIVENDPDTFLPQRDKNGKIIRRKTAGIQGVMADVIEAVRDQDVMMIHVVDAIETVNSPETTPSLLGQGEEGTPEGYIFASLDALALDTLCSNYLSSNVPLREAHEARIKYSLPTEFLQKVPLPRFDGKNIITEQGYDSPVSRFDTLLYLQERGIGQMAYYVTGEDTTQGGSLASYNGHLGTVKNSHFQDNKTTHWYYSYIKPLWDIQATVLAYASANDHLTGSDYIKRLLDAYDENGDGIIDFGEKGKGSFSPFALFGVGRMMGMEHTKALQVSFLLNAVRLRQLRKEWNTDGEESSFLGGIASEVGTATLQAMKMSQQKEERHDPFSPGVVWGNGKWPSIQYIRYLQISRSIYGPKFPDEIDSNSMYGCVFRYASLKYGNKHASAVEYSDIDKYIEATRKTQAPLPFKFYVPTGYGKAKDVPIPNIEETDNCALVFSAIFNDSQEVWHDLSYLDFKP